MRYIKPKGVSDPISRLRREEGWNSDKRKKTLFKNRAMLDKLEGNLAGDASVALKASGTSYVRGSIPPALRHTTRL